MASFTSSILTRFPEIISHCNVYIMAAILVSHIVIQDKFLHRQASRLWEGDLDEDHEDLVMSYLRQQDVLFKSLWAHVAAHRPMTPPIVTFLLNRQDLDIGGYFYSRLLYSLLIFAKENNIISSTQEAEVYFQACSVPQTKLHGWSPHTKE